MKKILYILIISIASLSFYSCEDELLDKAPQDAISDPEFWNSASDLELYINKFYNNLPSWSKVGTGFTYMPDSHTDVGLYTNRSTRLDGANNVPSSGGGWTWTNVRNINYYLENVDRADLGDLTDHYIGEGHFFRAWIYFGLLTQFGDLPIIKQTVDVSDEEILYAARDSRTDVVNFIIEDLDAAIAKMKDAKGISASRLNRDVAALFKARVCLYEGTWEKYHAGTAFAGDTDGTNYLQLAVTAANTVISSGNYSIAASGSNPYLNLFNKEDYSTNSEVMFWKDYDFLTYGNSFGNDMNGEGPSRSGITREMMRSYLCADGLPVGLSPIYQGDMSLENVVLNRDPRCVEAVMTPGDIITLQANGDTTIFEVPVLTDNNYCPTGYQYEKFKSPVLNSVGARSKDIARIIFRYAEALLIYAEAKAELGTINQSDLDNTINVLRDRVGMPHLTINPVADPNWPDWGYTVSPILQEVRRERKVELMGEGYRFADLMRWKAEKLIVGYSPKGTFYSDLLKAENPNMSFDSEGYLEPYQGDLLGPNGGYGFDPSRDYLQPLPSDQLVLNPILGQNPGW
ncbi:MAG: RagB/SusD family nutrient uptake outer membrane protein [Bacteroidetes bacterium]|nr:RagB/SusD family nutrient uptake outer membrane protein [Bacteroidota bacterium]